MNEFADQFSGLRKIDFPELLYTCVIFQLRITLNLLINLPDGCFDASKRLYHIII